MWQKYFWKKNRNEIVGLYSYCNTNEEYFMEITFRNKTLSNLTILNRYGWIQKWDQYYPRLTMLGIRELMELDNLLWKYYK